jgi:hypothetical protein
MASSISHCRLIVAEPGYASRREAARAWRCARARRNLSHPPARQNVSFANAGTHRGVAAAWWFAAFLCHGGLAYAAFRAPMEREPVRETIQVHVVSTPQKLPAVTPIPLQADEPNRPAPAPKRLVRKHVPKPTAPLEEPKAAPEPMPEVVGLTVASTTIDGAGLAFATGQTLSGATETVAKPYIAPTQEPLPPTPAQRPSRNRVARAQAAQGVHVEPARKLSQTEPEYPALLQSYNTSSS